MIVVWYKQYLNVKLLNLMSNSLSKIRQCLVLFLIGGTLYMLYGKLRTKYMVSCIFKNYVLNIVLDYVQWMWRCWSLVMSNIVEGLNVYCEKRTRSL